MNGRHGTLLHQRFSLGDVDDVEQLCRAAIDRFLKRSPSTFLTEADFDDLLAELIAFCWKIWRNDYDPAHGLTFGSYASWRLRFAIVDHFRRRFGRHGERRPPAGSVYLSELVDGQLDAALPPSEGDGTHDRAAALGWLLPERDRGDVRAAFDEVAKIARTPKGVGRLLDELRQEIEQQAA